MFSTHLRYSLTVLLLVVFVLASWAQQPLYTQFGNNSELNGVEIYGITQDSRDFIWLTTSNGIYRTDGVEFKNFKSENMTTQEFFRPCLTSSDILYCTDILGNIYRLNGDRIEPFMPVTKPNSYLDRSMFTSGEFLYITSYDSLFRIDTSGQMQAVFGYKQAFWGCQIITQKHRDTLSIYTSNRREKINIHHDKTEVMRLDRETAKSRTPHRQVITNTALLFLEEGDPGIGRINSLGPVMIDEAGNFWRGFRDLKGVMIRRPWMQSPALIFDEYYVNYLFEDRDGNLWIGTRNNGLILISDVEHFSLIEQEEIIQLEYSPLGLAALTQHQCFAIDHDKYRPLLHLAPNELILYSYHSPDGRAQFLLTSYFSYIIKDGRQIYRNKLNTSLIKNHRWINDTTVALATISGAWLLNPYNPRSARMIGSDNDRTLDMLYIPAKEGFLISMFNTLKWVDDQNRSTEILYNGQPISIEHMQVYGNKVWGVGSSGQIFSIDLDTYRIELKAQANINYLAKAVFVNEHIYIIDKQRVYDYHIEERILHEIHVQHSAETHLSDGVVIGDILWLASNKGLINFNLESYHNKRSVIPTISVQVFKGFDQTPVSDEHNFKHDENYISFTIQSADFAFPRANTVRFRLIGVDEDYTLTQFNDFVSYRSLSPGNYTFEAEAISPLGVTSEAISYSFTIHQPWHRTWYAYVGFALGVILIYMGVFYSQIKRNRVKRELVRRVQSAQINAIIAQMNPHFIFNCLNSIQDLILQQDIRGSINYLGKFSNLTRMTMQDSQKEVVPLSREIETLQLYLELEALRFKDLSYKIEHSMNDDQLEKYSIPPMLIQPFIENSLKHGLLHTANRKRLELDIDFENRDLVFKVKDNGVGRARAMEIKQRQSKIRSFSGGAIAKRIDLINSQGNYNIHLQTFDLNNENNLGWTTVVELRFINFIPLNDD